jgi:hypothetical protein
VSEQNLSAVALAADSTDDSPKQCGKIARLLLITDMFTPEVEAMLVCVLVPLRTISSDTPHGIPGRDFLTQFLAVIGFTNSETFRHEQHHRGSPSTLFPVVGLWQ